MKFIPILKKDLIVLLKDKGAIIVLFILPIMFISVMSFALGAVYAPDSDKGVSIPVVNLDGSGESVMFIESLRSVKGLDIITETNESKLTESKAKELVKNGKYAMALFIPDQFGEKVLLGDEVALISYEDPAQASTTSVVSKAIEGVSQTFSVQFTISNLVDEQVKGIQTTFDSKLDEMRTVYDNRLKEEIEKIAKQAQIPIDVPASTTDTGNQDTVDYEAIKADLTEKASSSMSEPSIKVNSTFDNIEKVPQPDAFQQNVPGYTVMFAFFTVMFAGRSFIHERNEGTFRRILSAPINRLQLFIGKMLPNYFIGILQTMVMFCFGHFAFGMSLGSSVIGLLLISLSMVWASTTLGMLIASIVRTESQVTGFSMLIVLTLAALGGTMVPLFIMPDIMQKIALVTPHAWALSGYQDLLVRGMGATDVLGNVAALFAFGFIFILVSIWRMRFDD
ncbi:ABC transporter permease [Paenibacillus sp. NEAU-GSW1]|uniref:ABC transporter permease n=1 Tax=Paenibacillus sp. NEAU-GSW1 TaxID=2682486 RepID=UPI001C12B55A|nr:ABC transporter permease [Paenibacillus sp. NEAU-GSW1]